MSAKIDPEMLMAYADGELDAVSMKRVERAIAADPEAAEQVERHRALRVTLSKAFDPVATEPMPEALMAALVRPKVVDLATERAARAAPAQLRCWVLGSAIAASLAIGLFVGQQIPPGGSVVSRSGALVASGSLARALDTQLASTQGDATAVRMLVTFRDRSGAVCRTFTTQSMGGIACRDNDAWVFRETRSRTATAVTEYRQAGSNDAALMADAEAAMSGEPFDAAAETRARQNGWRSAQQ